MPFEVESHVGYQKPKPRQFMTAPRQKVVEAPVEVKRPAPVRKSAPKEKPEKKIDKVEKESLKKEAFETKDKRKDRTKMKSDSVERKGHFNWKSDRDYWTGYDPYQRRSVPYDDEDYVRGPNRSGIRGNRGGSRGRPYPTGRYDAEREYYPRAPPRYQRMPPRGEYPDRPGYFAGSRPFKMDRKGYPPLEDERPFKKGRESARQIKRQ